MNRPSSARRIWSISSAVPASRGTTSVAANRRMRGDVGVVGERVDARRVPSRCPAARRRVRARACLGGVDGGAVVAAVLGQPERLPQPGHRSGRRRTAGGRAGSPAPGRVRLPRGLFAEDVQAVADLDVLDLAQPAVDVQQHVVERVVVGPLVQSEVVVHLRGPHQRPDLLPDRGQLAGIERGDVGVLVEQLLQPRDVAVGFGAGHRRDEVVDQRGVRAALGLRALPRIVDQERVDQRQVAQRGVGAARRRHAERLAGQPLQVAVLAEVHDRVGAETPVAPSRSSGRRPGSGGWAAGRDRGRSRPGSRRNRAAAAPSARRCPPASRR